MCDAKDSSGFCGQNRYIVPKRVDDANDFYCCRYDYLKKKNLPISHQSKFEIEVCIFNSIKTQTVDFHCYKILLADYQDRDTKAKINPPNPYVNLTAVEGKSHLRLKFKFTLVELQVISNRSPFLRITVSFSDSMISGGTSGTGSIDHNRDYHVCCWTAHLYKHVDRKGHFSLR